MSYFSEHNKGFIGTIIVHGIILMLLLYLGFFTPLPLPGEEGILVNIGNEDFGLGKEEPAPAKVVSPVKEEEKQPEPVAAPRPTNQKLLSRLKRKKR